MEVADHGFEVCIVQNSYFCQFLTANISKTIVLVKTDGKNVFMGKIQQLIE